MDKFRWLSVRDRDDMLSDRISDLPRDVMNIILSRIPLRDVVRTSVLSTKWKLHWTRAESLVFDRSFTNGVFFSGSAYLSIVKGILSSHRGPVRKFHLYVPNFTCNRDDISLLILYVSQFGVQDLTLEFEDDEADCEYLSSVFRCLELKHLSLKFSKSFMSIENENPMKLPTHDFRKLSSLMSLDLCREHVYGDDITNIISNCPLLERLCLDYNGTISVSDPFVITAPKLKFLSVSYGYVMDFSLENSPNISTLLLRKKVRGVDGNKDIVDFFGSVPTVKTINLTGDILLEWDQYDLTVSYLNMHSLAQIRSIFCLIKSSPKLLTLDVLICQPKGNPEAAVNYLKSQMKVAEILACLRTVKIAGFSGVKHEIVFVAIVLSRCPNLQKIYMRIGRRIHISPDAKSKMMAFFKRFRASAQAMIVFSN